MTQYLAANGLPFSDRDAAEFKAQRVRDESGAAFEIVTVEGGFVVEDCPVDLAAHCKASNCMQTAPQNEPAMDRSATVEQPFVLSLRPAWRAQFVGLFLTLLGLVLMIAPAWPVAWFSSDAVYAINSRIPGLWDQIRLIGVAIVVTGIGMTLWRRYYQRSVITNVGVMQSVGILFNRHISEIDMANIHVVNVKQPHLVHMLMNLGTVELSTPGSSGADVAIVDVVAPRRVAAFVREQVARTRAYQRSTTPFFRSPNDQYTDRRQ